MDLIKQNTAVESKSEKHETGIYQIDKPQGFREDVLWTDETTLERFGNELKSALCSQVQNVKHLFTVHTVKHEGCVMHRVSGICVLDTMKFQDHQGILQ